jgi:ribonucleoside-diphosphate reductase subunit M2
MEQEKKRIIDDDEYDDDDGPLPVNVNLKKIFQNNSISEKNNSSSELKYEPILDKKNKRFTVFPIKYKDFWNMFKKQQSSFWIAEEIDFSRDLEDFNSLSKDEQHFLKRILAFFASSDGIVNFNLEQRFVDEIQIMEAKIVYDFQKMMENIHGEVYSLMLDTLVQDTEEKNNLFNSIHTIPSIKSMADWAFKWIDSDKHFSYRVVAFTIVEGVFFSGAFAAIFWFKKYKNKGKNFLQGLCKSNEFIARDEGMHTDFGCLIYKHLNNKLSQNEINEIIIDGVNVSKIFIDDALPYNLIGMNKVMMSDYIEYVADRLLVDLGYNKIYNKKNPFKFMETIGLTTKTNFFEQRSTEYSDPNIFNKNNNKTLNFDNVDF